MRKVVFYSWQSDLPNATNRGFIQSALENAASIIAADDTVAIEPVVDRDTQGVAGAPDIASTIFAKITVADVFVADVSIVSHPPDGRPSPNPNVLIELGFALRALGQERIILVFNRAFGKIEELPFDLRTRRMVVYDMPTETSDRAPERRKLEESFNESIRVALDHARATTVVSPAIPALEAIENNHRKKVIVLRQNLETILNKLDDLLPWKHSTGGTLDELLVAIHATQEPVAEFSKIAEIISVLDDQECALEMYRWFGQIFERYDYPRNYNGKTSAADFDHFKFVGHEMFATLFAFLLREQRWAMIENLLKEPIPVRYLQHESGPGNVYWDYASEHLGLVRKEGRMSLHADLLHERHATGGLAVILPEEEFIAADYFLYLYGDLHLPEESRGMEWRAWSTVYMDHTPMFIKNAEQTSIANVLMRIFKVPDIGEFKTRLVTRSNRLGRLWRGGSWDSPLRNADIERLATRV